MWAIQHTEYFSFCAITVLNAGRVQGHIPTQCGVSTFMISYDDMSSANRLFTQVHTQLSVVVGLCDLSI